MRTNIKAKNTTLTPTLSSHIEEKIFTPLRRFLVHDESAIVDVEIELTTRHHKKGNIWRAEVNCAFSGAMLRAEKTADDAHAVIDLIEEEITREVKQFKEKERTDERRGGRLWKRMLRRIRGGG